MATDTDRLAKLERIVRRQWIGLVMCVSAGLTCLLVAAGRDVPDEIRARSFVAVDNDGQPLVTITTKAGGELEMLDANGNRVHLHVGYGAPTLELTHGATKNQSYLSPGALVIAGGDSVSNPMASVFLKDGHPQLSLAFGPSRVVASADADSAGITIDGSASSPKVQLLATPTISTIGIHDAEGDPRVHMAVTDKNEPSLRLYDADWKQQAILSCTPGMAGLALSPDGGEPTLALRATRDGTAASLGGAPGTSSMVLEGGVASTGLRLWDGTSHVVGALAVVEDGVGLHLGSKDGSASIAASVVNARAARISLEGDNGYTTWLQPGSTEDEAVSVMRSKQN